MRRKLGSATPDPLRVPRSVVHLAILYVPCLVLDREVTNCRRPHPDRRESPFCLVDKVDGPCRPTIPGTRPRSTRCTLVCVRASPAPDTTRTGEVDRKTARDPENLLVLEDDGQLIGSAMVGYEGHRGWINYLAVHPDRQRQGLGRLLMAEAESRLRDLGCAKVNLQVRRSNEAATEFYQRIGYAIDDVISLGKRLE